MVASGESTRAALAAGTVVVGAVVVVCGGAVTATDDKEMMPGATVSETFSTGVIRTVEGGEVTEPDPIASVVWDERVRGSGVSAMIQN